MDSTGFRDKPDEWQTFADLAEVGFGPIDFKAHQPG
jgi:hypothetical protein